MPQSILVKLSFVSHIIKSYNQIIKSNEDPRITKRVLLLNLIISELFTVWNKQNAQGNEETINSNLFKLNPLPMSIPKAWKNAQK